MYPMLPRCALLLAFLLPAARAAMAQGGDQERASRFQSIPWEAGPTMGNLGEQAEVRVPEGCQFTQAPGARTFMELTENPPSGAERGVVICADRARDSYWFVVFSYSAMGYVKDDEKDQLDADKILASLREGTEEGNRERRSRGWETITLEGWVRPPYYDSQTNNLTWSTTVAGETGGKSVNHSVRLLGRGGVMNADLVMDPDQVTTAMPMFDGIVAGYGYKTGHSYAEWRQGDKVAKYGLTALIAGGAGVIAAKTGLLGKLWKLLVAAGAALVIGLKKLFGRNEPAAAGGGRTGGSARI